MAWMTLHMHDMLIGRVKCVPRQFSLPCEAECFINTSTRTLHKYLTNTRDITRFKIFKCADGDVSGLLSTCIITLDTLVP
jgi:hypothetical protein